MTAKHRRGPTGQEKPRRADELCGDRIEVSEIVIRITPEQSKRINALVKKCCANCVRGNCLLLDDGDEHPCPQLISFSRIMCNYLRDVVLPLDFDLYTELVGGRTKKCKHCGKEFFIRSPRQVYCPTCGEQNKRDNAAQRQQRKRDKRHAFGG